MPNLLKTKANPLKARLILLCKGEHISANSSQLNQKQKS